MPVFKRMVPHLKMIVIFGIFTFAFSIRIFFQKQKESRGTDAWLAPASGADGPGTRVEARLETY
jgi:hypothetical protein